MKKIILALTMCVFAGFTFTSPAESAPRQNHGYSQQQQVKKTSVRKKSNVRKQTVRKNSKKRVRVVINTRTNTVTPQAVQSAQALNYVHQDDDSPANYWAKERERALRQTQTAAAFGDPTASRTVRQQRASRTSTYDNNSAQPVVFWNNSHMQRAESMIGLTARGNRQQLKNTFARTLGHSIDPTRIPWCAAWANAVLADAGIEGTGSLMARSFTNWGKPTASPQKGDVVVLRRGRSSRTGHVGFFYGFVDHNGVKKVALLGGNQGKQVGISYFPISKVIAYRTVG